MKPALHINKVLLPCTLIISYLPPVPHKIVARKNLIQYLGSMTSWRRVTVKLRKTRLLNQDWLPWQPPAYKRDVVGQKWRNRRACRCWELSLSLSQYLPLNPPASQCSHSRSSFRKFQGGGQPPPPQMKPCHALVYTNIMFGCFLFLVEHQADRGSVWQPSNGADLSGGTAEDGETSEH